MWKKFVKDYLSFTKRDRVGVLVLLTLILLVVLLPYIWPVKRAAQASRQEVEKIRLQTAGLNKPDDSRSFPTPAKEGLSPAYSYITNRNEHTSKTVFYFDPNTLNAEGWERLGIRKKTVTTIVNYLAKGGRFRRPEDINKIYGLFKDDYDRLLPYVQIKPTGAERMDGEEKIEKAKREYATNEKPVYPAKHVAAIAFIDINLADTAAWIALPGIGSKLATRIINFRDKLGGFYAVQQVGETYGLPDSTFRKIQTFLQCNHTGVVQLNINTGDASTLKQHPYIRWNLANAIVQYRTQHGNYKTVEEVQQIALITPEIFQKIKPYLTVQ